MIIVDTDTFTHGPVVPNHLQTACKGLQTIKKKPKRTNPPQVFNFNSPQVVTAKKQAQKICHVVNIITGISILLTSVEMNWRNS